MARIQLPRTSIRWILLLAVVAPVLAVSLVLTALAYRTGERAANDLAAQNSRQIHQRIESHLNHLMDLPASINRINRSRLDAAVLALDDPGRNPKLIFETLQAFPDVSSIVLGSVHGQVTWIIRYPGESSYEYAIKDAPDGAMKEYAISPDGKIDPAPVRTYPFNTVMRPWFRAAADANAPTWAQVYVWVRGGKGVTLGVPYVEPYHNAAGELAGVINCELTLSDISSFLERLKIGKTGIAFIMERDGNLVATSIGVNCMRDGVARVAAAQIADPRIALAASQLARRPGSLEGLDGMNLEHVEIAGQPGQMVVSPFRNRRNLDWLIVTIVPDADFMTDIQRMRTRSAAIGAVAVIVALILGSLLALWLLKPILALVAHARRVGGGEFDARIHCNDNREIKELCQAMNEMASGLQDRMRLRHALDLAMEVQQSLLPSSSPQVKGLDVAARSKYCDETGGDYYDYLDVEGTGPDTLMIAMGDVTGHGIAAAMLMATARGVLRSQAGAKGSLGELLTHVNRHLVADTGGDRFMTMFLAIIDVSTMSMRWASAGHDQPLIYDPKSGLLTEIDVSGGGLPLGVVGGEIYEEQSYSHLKPGQIMLIGTDGLWEATNHSGEQFGKQRVGEAMAASVDRSAAEVEAEIYKRLQEFGGGRANADDITYIVIKFSAN